MKVAVVGSRSFNDYEQVKRVLDQYSISLIISGGAKGADKLAERYAKENNIPTSIYLPNYDEFGKRAPLIRNDKIVDEAELVIAFWDGESRGTKYTIMKAYQKGILCLEAAYPTPLI
jgi:hypothetical protein